MIFTPSTPDESAERQRDLLEDHEAGFAEGDLLVLRLFEVRSGGAGELVTSGEAAAARTDFGVGEGLFTVVLVGRDGGARFSSGGPVPAPELFARIDAMPPAPPRGAREEPGLGVLRG